MIVAGIDEAGYGPTLGPLVVSVSVFRVHEPSPPPEAVAAEPGDPQDLWTRLEGAVCRKPDGLRIPVDDSKKLFHQNQKKGLQDLEEGVLPFIYLREGVLHRDFRSFLARVARRGSALGRRETSSPEAYLDEYPWYRERNLDMPIDTYPAVVRSRARTLREALEASRVELLGIAAWPVEVLEFNRSLSESENKALVSFHAVGSFLERLYRRFPEERVEVLVDRQGGRMRYGPLLYEKVRPKTIRIEAQTDELSTYLLVRGRRSGMPFRVSFAVDCETRSFPVSLASMLSKYIREAHMVLFNRFWKEHMSELEPTAGYAVDARRFLGAIHDLRGRLGIDDALLVRRR